MGTRNRMIVVHHAGDGQAAKTATFAKIKKWHTQPRPDGGKPKFKKIAYHWVINRNGKGRRGRRDNETGAHCATGNRGRLGVCVCGNFNAQQPNPEQWRELVRICAEWCLRYNISPGNRTIVGHKDVQKKKKHGPNTCPGRNLHNKLPQLRIDVATHIAHSERAGRRRGRYVA